MWYRAAHFRQICYLACSVYLFPVVLVLTLNFHVTNATDLTQTYFNRPPPLSSIVSRIDQNLSRAIWVLRRVRRRQIGRRKRMPMSSRRRASRRRASRARVAAYPFRSPGRGQRPRSTSSEPCQLPMRCRWARAALSRALQSWRAAASVHQDVHHTCTARLQMSLLTY